MKILITGCAGFIGYSLSKKLLEEKNIVYGIDNLDNYYSTNLKKLRVKNLKKYTNFYFKKVDISNLNALKNFLHNQCFEYVFHFAAQAGVRYSLINPKKYYLTNIKGYLNLIESLNKRNIKKIIYASSSSVYGDQKKYPTKEEFFLKAKNPYALSKVINEKYSEFYSKKYNIVFIGLRFFTVYGEWGRPDMFILKLLNAIYNNKTFYLNNSGDHYRDFTYIDDVSEICTKLLKKKIKKKHLIFNICASNQVNILNLSKKIIKKFPKSKIKNVKADKADVYRTLGDNRKIKQFVQFKEFTNINFGLKKTMEWYNLNHKYLK